MMIQDGFNRQVVQILTNIQESSTPNEVGKGEHMRRIRANRRGATVLELAFVLGIFVTLTFGMFDLGLGVFRYHILANAARQAARRAVVHGASANARMGPWGPAMINVPATAHVPIVDGDDFGGYYRDGIRPMLVGCDLPNTWITVEWIDGHHDLQERVRATVTSPYRPFMPFLHPVTLRACSTMQIVH